MESRTLLGSSVVPLRLVFFMWLVFSLEIFLQIDLGWLGIQPRTLTGLIGVLTAPLVHGNLSHLISNTLPILFLGAVLFYFYPRIAVVVFARSYLITNMLVWLLSPRVSYHIGASGLVYGLSAFLISFGLLRRDFWSMLISAVVFFMYGGIFYGVFPGSAHVSWESHLAGALVGLGTAYGFRDMRKL
jgi:membrane associated rhomboid family serine protease